MIKLLDTDVVINFLGGYNPEITKKIKDLIAQGIDLTITQITLSELWYGIYRLKSKSKRILESKKLNNLIIDRKSVV